eukprot:695464-Pleurochrysis_carterae.AAC.2
MRVALLRECQESYRPSRHGEGVPRDARRDWVGTLGPRQTDREREAANVQKCASEAQAHARLFPHPATHASDAAFALGCSVCARAQDIAFTRRWLQWAGACALAAARGCRESNAWAHGIGWLGREAGWVG